MDISHTKAKKTKTEHRSEYIMVKISEKEALNLIKSLTSQIIQGHSNAERVEFFASYISKNNQANKLYFSVAVN